MHDTVVGMLENNTGIIDKPRAYLARGTSNRLVSRHRHQTVLMVLPVGELSDTGAIGYALEHDTENG